MVGFESVSNETEQTTGGVLDEGASELVGVNGDIGMSNDRRGDKDGGPGWKSNHKLEIPQDEVATTVGVEAS